VSEQAAAGNGEPGIAIDLLTDPAGVPRARAMLQRAEWAAGAFARYGKRAVDRITHAAATAGAAKAREYAEWAVRETGFGVAEHKVIKNLACSTGLVEAYASHDYVTPRFDPATKIVEVPRPAGVVFALTPSTNPVATVFFKSLLALMTRSAIVISPHPLARECCADAARTLAAAAVAAGAPDGVIQVVDEPSVPLINALMTDDRTSVIVATGGVPVVRAAHSSGTPAIGVGPGNVPVLVDATADLARAAKRITDSKSFDNSILCTNESVLIVEEAAAAGLLRHLKREGAHLLGEEETAKVRDLLFPGGHFDIRFVGKDATSIAAEAGLRVPGTTRVLLAPFALAVSEEPLAHEKLCPVLGLLRVPTAAAGIRAARAVLRTGGRGHSAAIHSTDPKTIMEYGAAVEVLRVSVNAGNSLGASGIETHLAPSMTVGTGYFGGSNLRENLQPGDFVQWTRMAYNSDPAEPFGSFSGLIPWEVPSGPVPPYPFASNTAEGRRQRGYPDAADITPRPGNAPAGAARVPGVAGGGYLGAEDSTYGGVGREVGAGLVETGRADRGVGREVAAGLAGGPGLPGGMAGTGHTSAEMAALREEIRRLVIEELAALVGERGG
jgi:acetaldehyde dehydrogenase / alcohol dehydrogenase